MTVGISMSGSKRRDRKGKQEYLDYYLSMDINILNKHKALTTGAIFSIIWGDIENSVNTAAVTVKEGYLEVLHQYKSDTRLGPSVESTTYLTHTRCNYGSRRPWFLCPSCDGRVAKLYSLESGFLCRKCSDMPYESQSESRRYRALRKARKIRMRLEGDANLLNTVILPPKGMHWKTYNRLVNQEREISFYVNTAIERLLNNYRCS